MAGWQGLVLSAALVVAGCVGDHGATGNYGLTEQFQSPVRVAGGAARSGGAGSSGTSPAPSARATLPASGQGNAGGVLTLAGAVPLAGVEATVSYNGPQGRASGVQVSFHNGPMTGVSVICDRPGGGSAVPRCQTVNAETAWLVNELSGQYAHAAAIAILGYGPDGNADGFVVFHSGPGMTPGEAILLPGDTVSYHGAFQAGAELTRNGQAYSGSASGTVLLTADFSDGTLSGHFDGTLTDADSNASVALNAGFERAVIGVDGSFYNGAETEFAFADSPAWGQIDGGFYGPNAEEAAGSYSFGNSHGGMTGIFLGCSAYSGINCVANAPR